MQQGGTGPTREGKYQPKRETLRSTGLPDPWRNDQCQHWQEEKNQRNSWEAAIEEAEETKETQERFTRCLIASVDDVAIEQWVEQESNLNSNWIQIWGCRHGRTTDGQRPVLVLTTSVSNYQCKTSAQPILQSFCSCKHETWKILLNASSTILAKLMIS